MNGKLNEACHKALNAFNMSDYLSKKQIADAIAPFSAVDDVIAELKNRGFIKSFGFDGYKVTPLGKESRNDFIEAINDEIRQIKDRKRIILQSWISTCISMLSLIVSVVAILISLGMFG